MGEETTLKGRLTYWIARKTQWIRRYGHNRYVARPLNQTKDFAGVDLRSFFYHVVKKTAIHIFLRFIRTPPPEMWPDLLTGARADYARFLLREYFPNEREFRRSVIAEKIWWVILDTVDHDTNYAEIFDYTLYRTIIGRPAITFDCAHYIDPLYWCMDDNTNPMKPPVGPGRNPRDSASRCGRVVPPPEIKYFTVLHADDRAIIIDKELSISVVKLRDVNDPMKYWFVVVDKTAGKPFENEWVKGWRYEVILKSSDLGEIVDKLNEMGVPE